MVYNKYIKLMATEQDEAQAKEFLKRVEIITMKKDLRKLREVDAIKERDKIVKVEFQTKPTTTTTTNANNLQEMKEKFEREKILNKNYVQETEAKEQLKNYATEEERQKIFILESEKIELNKQAEEDRAKKEPELIIKKNEAEIEKSKLEGKLKDIQDQEEKMEAEQKIISEKEKTTNVEEEKEVLEKRRWELEEQTKEIEKRRWGVEREIEDKNKEIKTIDQDYKTITDQENILKQRITTIDKQLRQIYEQIILKIQETKAKEKKDREMAEGEISKQSAIKKEKIQREQWTKTPSAKYRNKEYSQKIPITIKTKLEKQVEDEEEHRKKFLESIEAKANEEQNNN